MFWLAISPLVLFLIFLVSFTILDSRGVFDRHRDLKRELKSLNHPYKCDCGITSRKYQLLKDDYLVCPHCERKLWECADMIDDDREFPFAPKINKKEAKRYLKNREEMKKVKKEMRNLDEYDKEIEIWQKMQLRKMEEYQRKANQIKNELDNV